MGNYFLSQVGVKPSPRRSTQVVYLLDSTLALRKKSDLNCPNKGSQVEPSAYIFSLKSIKLRLAMSQIINRDVLNFVLHLPADINPYQATADYVATFLLPCPLPSWSRYVQYVIAVEFLIMFLQSTYILYTRSKTKKIYHIGLNSMGLIQLDRANHCALCYFLYSIIAAIEIICAEFVRSGRLDQGWPNFILGIKFIVTVACAGHPLAVRLPFCFGQTEGRFTKHESHGKIALNHSNMGIEYIVDGNCICTYCGDCHLLLPTHPGVSPRQRAGDARCSISTGVGPCLYTIHLQRGSRATSSR
ncbi:uncharacterized protein MELLADRAFT_86067 [Melampsora larici-populina 98AG31]|uniref:Uncharacterized protein n=1 Tax=Melampsora larici-populina (strain 98AG31 / pathotype 3-4-7) TaxID=747676 RepID=F4RKN4_MELLP|nr:uncharacterized protein MELLADRAFT_86067 [Melampsora larici-populina 98AG31]EGG07147.1 hypothetical protein MELLADRAFT_86067 [Melampsora larici-populina 98AG31]